jgi:magnesium transporter
MLEVYISSASNRLNDIMRVLTVIATIFIPLTFIVGVYGMNFTVNEASRWAMPELRWDYGYPFVWAVMIAISGGMLYYFKRRKWF